MVVYYSRYKELHLVMYGGTGPPGLIREIRDKGGGADEP